MIRARIPKGTPIWGTFGGGEKVAGRSYVVMVHDLDGGYLPMNAYDAEKGYGRVANVCWVGTGGYWHYAALEDVEIVEGQDEANRMLRRFAGVVDDHTPAVTRALLAKVKARYLA